MIPSLIFFFLLQFLYIHLFVVLPSLCTPICLFGALFVFTVSTYQDNQVAKMSDSHFANWTPYKYDPSGAAAGIFMVLFLLSTFLHAYQLFRTRTWFFIPLLIGGICMSPLLQPYGVRVIFFC